MKIMMVWEQTGSDTLSDLHAISVKSNLSWVFSIYMNLTI